VARCESGDFGGLQDLEQSIRISEATGDASRSSAFYNNLAVLTWRLMGLSWVLRSATVHKKLGTLKATLTMLGGPKWER
jgi:hypothetical protein